MSIIYKPEPTGTHVINKIKLGSRVTYASPYDDGYFVVLRDLDQTPQTMLLTAHELALLTRKHV